MESHLVMYQITRVNKMDSLPNDVLEVIVRQCVENGTLYFGLVCSCHTLNSFGKHRLTHLKSKETMQAIEDDDIESMAVYVHFLEDVKAVDDCIKLSLLNGSVKVSWWLWNQYRPCLTMQILIDIEKMFRVNHYHCSEILHSIIMSVRCGYEAANQRRRCVQDL